jgi:hypothetical protein
MHLRGEDTKHTRTIPSYVSQLLQRRRCPVTTSQNSNRFHVVQITLEGVVSLKALTSKYRLAFASELKENPEEYGITVHITLQ